MRLATWNVNSIRSRADRVAAWLERSDVDVVALQETKCRDDQFPEMMFNAIGYEVAHVGYSQWNGVAILSRVGIDDVQIGFPGQPTWGETPVEEARALGATCGGVRVWSLYVTGDPGASDEAAKVGSLSIRLGLGWAKSHAFYTGQCPVMKYNRRLMMAILNDRVQIAKNVNATVIPLEEAPRGYAEFDQGAARKYVLDPNGMVGASS